jgi:hypothetical protein
MGLSGSYSFQAGCRGFESRLPLHANLVANEKFHFSLAKEGARSSVAERPAHNRLVAGSNPAEPISQQTR